MAVSKDPSITNSQNQGFVSSTKTSPNSPAKITKKTSNPVPSEEKVTFGKSIVDRSISKRLEERSDQKKAIDDVLEGLKTNDRGQLIRPCGSGKSLISQRIIEAYGQKTNLVLVPSLSLLKQSLEGFHHNRKKAFDYQCVCSDAEVNASQKNYPISHDFSDFGKLSQVSTDPKHVAQFLKSKTRKQKIIFSTYQSLPSVCEALSQTETTIDLVLADEAHKTAGDISTNFALVHDSSALPASKRVYITATPRVLGSVKNTQTTKRVACMNNEKIYGPVLHEMSFKEAIDEGIILDYEVVICEIDIAKFPAKLQACYQTNHRDPHVNEEINKAALKRVVDQYGCKKIMSFHTLNQHAERFAFLMSSELGFHSVHVNGSMSAKSRQNKFDQYSSSAKTSLITNAQCLCEGVDLPDTDAVFYADRKESPVSIIQSAGRCMRKPKTNMEKSHGLIIVPIVRDPVKQGDKIWGNWDKLVEIVTALAENDERMISYILDPSAKQGHSNSSSTRPKISFMQDMDSGFNYDLSEHFHLRVLKTSKTNINKLRFPDFQSLCDAIHKKKIERPPSTKRWFDAESKTSRFCSFSLAQQLFRLDYPEEQATPNNIAAKIWGKDDKISFDTFEQLIQTINEMNIARPLDINAWFRQQSKQGLLCGPGRAMSLFAKAQPTQDHTITNLGNHLWQEKSKITFNSFDDLVQAIRDRGIDRPGDIGQWFHQESNAGNLCSLMRAKTLFSHKYPNTNTTPSNIASEIWPEDIKVNFETFDDLASTARKIKRKRPKNVYKWFAEQSKLGKICGFDLAKTLFKQSYQNKEASVTNIADYIWAI